jgi:hypothetical protein
MIKKLLLVNLLSQQFPKILSMFTNRSSGTAKWLCVVVVFLLMFFSDGLYAQKTWTGATSNDWNTASNWNTNGVPTATQSVTIPNTTQNPVINGIAVCASLTMTNAAGTGDNVLTINSSGSLVVTGLVTLTSPTANNKNTILDVGAGSLTAGSISLTNSSSDSIDSSLRISTGTVDVLGNIGMAGSANRNDITFSGDGILNIRGTITGGRLVPATGTVNYSNAGTQTVGSYTYYNLTLSGSGAKTLSNTRVVNNILSMEGTASASAAPTYDPSATLQYNTATARTAGAEWLSTFAGSGGIVIANTGMITMNNAKVLGSGVPLTINSGATLMTNNNALTFQGDFINEGTFIGGGSAITISGPATQSIGSFSTTGSVTMSKAIGGIAALTGDVSARNLVINSSGGILSLGEGLTHTFTGNWERTSGTLNGGSSIFRINGNITGTGSTFTAENGTVELYGGNQNLGTAPVTYNNLIFSGTGTKTVGAVVTVNGTWSILAPVKAGLGTITTHAANALILHGSGPLSGSWGSTSSVADHRNNAYFTTTSGRVNVISPIANNYASYNNATENMFASVGESTGPLVLTAPDGFVFINAKFASYGTPGGIGPDYTIGGCNAPNSAAVTTSLLGKTAVVVPASGDFNGTFGDPCNNTIKTFSIVATYALPICSGSNPGLIDGSTPTGGTGTYTYLWQRSNSATGGWSAAPGTNNAEDYTPTGTLTTTTYYKRIVTSGIYTSETIVVVPVISSSALGMPTITPSCSNSTLTVAAPTIPGTYVEWFSGSCGSTVIATGLTFNPTATGTYSARYKNACSTGACRSINLNTIPATNPVSITPTDPVPVCLGSLTASLPYTATGNPTTYNISWNPSGYLITVLYRTIPSATGGTITVDIPANIPAGTYEGTISVQTAAGCVSGIKTFKIAIGKAVGGASAYPTLCVDTALTPVTHVTTGATGIGTASGLPAGVSASWSGDLITISGTPTVSGTFNYNIPLLGSCSGNAFATGTIIVNDLPTAPTVSVTTQPNCTAASGTITVSSPLAGHFYSIDGTDYSNTTGLFTGVASGEYIVTVKNPSDCISLGTSVTVNTVTLKTWTGALSTNWNTAANWSPAGVPSAIDCVEITNVPNKPIISGTNQIFYANLLTINTNAELKVNSSNTLSVTGAVTVHSGGSLIFENNSSLVQDPAGTTNTNSGSIVYKRSSAPMKNFDFSYWSSPVAGQVLYDLSPNTLWDKYLSYSSTGWKSEVATTTTMTPGIGYIIRVPKPNATYSNAKDSWTGISYVQPVEFIGVPNNGTIYGETVTAGNFYLIGNPYPSALDAEEFLFGTNNSNNTILNGTIYFWTHNTAIQPSGSKYIYVADDYTSFNGTGGVLAGSGGEMPSGKIAAGQSFFASAKASGQIIFKNDMRIAGHNAQFMKPGKTSKTSGIEKHRIWLNMTNEQGAFKQALVGYVAGATNDFDNDFDGITFNGNSFLDFYSLNNTRKMVIQGRALPFENTDLVPLGFRSNIEGEFKIGIHSADGLLAGHQVYLEDKENGMVHDLTVSDYTFTTAKGTFNDRFVLKYTNVTLGADGFEALPNEVLVTAQNKTVTVNSKTQNIQQIVIYDLGGQLLYQKDAVSDAAFITPVLNFAQQVLLVKVVLQNGGTVTEKIILK